MDQTDPGTYQEQSQQTQTSVPVEVPDTTVDEPVIEPPARVPVAGPDQPALPTPPQVVPEPEPLAAPTIKSMSVFPGLVFQTSQITVSIYVDIAAPAGVSYVAVNYQTPVGSAATLPAGLVSGTKFDGRWAINFSADCHDFPAGSTFTLIPTVTDDAGSVTRGEPQGFGTTYAGNGRPFKCI